MKKYISLIFILFLAGTHFAHATILTLNPQTGGGGANVTVDGPLEATGFGSWSTAYGATASNFGGTPDTATREWLYADDNAGNFSITRPVYTFDTSAIGCGTVVSGTVSFAGTANGNSSANGASLNVYSVTLNTPNDVLGNDVSYATSNFGTTAFSNTSINFTSIINGLNAFILNASGLAYINKTGVTELALRSNLDVTNTAATARNYVDMGFVDSGVNLPVLSINYTPGSCASPSPSQMAFQWVMDN